MYIDIKTIRRIHLGLMVLVIVPLLTLLVRTTMGVSGVAVTADTLGVGFAAGIYVAWIACIVFAMGCGIVYAWRGYAKDAAEYYKSLLVLMVLSRWLGLIILLSYKGGFGLVAAITLAKIVVLSTLAFRRDLGARASWTLFYILLALDLVHGVLVGGPQEGIGVLVTSVLANLLMDGTIGLAIYGKYNDKAARGTK